MSVLWLLAGQLRQFDADPEHVAHVYEQAGGEFRSCRHKAPTRARRYARVVLCGIAGTSVARERSVAVRRAGVARTRRPRAGQASLGAG